MTRRLVVELLGFTALVLGAVLAILIVGQLAQVGDLLLAAGARAPWGAALGRGALILLEAALPLAGLVAAGLVYGRLRAEDAWIARAALGAGPGPALLPAVALGGLLALAAGWLAQGPVPAAVSGLRGVLTEAAAAAIEVPGRALPLPGGGVALRAPGDAFWAALPGGADGPLLLRAADARLEPGPGEAALALTDVRLWGPRLRVTVGEARLAVDGAPLARRLRMLGPPNALHTAALDPADPHHRFTAHRRRALAAMAPLWALLGALLGARLGGAVALAGGAAAVAGAYWLLRTGELSARAGFMSPALAAWAPALVLGLGLLWALARDGSLARPLR